MFFSRGLKKNEKAFQLRQHKETGSSFLQNTHPTAPQNISTALDKIIKTNNCRELENWPKVDNELSCGDC